jgi:hypothetical protein
MPNSLSNERSAAKENKNTATSSVMFSLVPKKYNLNVLPPHRQSEQQVKQALFQ